MLGLWHLIPPVVYIIARREKQAPVGMNPLIIVK
jgi:hypothetical protein